MLSKRYLAGGMFAIVVLSGCSTPTPTLYQWGGYQPAVYQYFRNDQTNPEEQIAALEKIIDTSGAKNQLVAPGIHAHLGMLYAQTGKMSEATAQFEKEMELFPESAPFMTFLLKNQKRNRL